MVEGRRPGGLTALAVLNFIIGIIGAIGLIALVALLGEVEAATEGQLEGGMLYLMILLGGVSCALLIISGIGYLGQKLVMGRYVGSAYGILGLVGTAIGLLSDQPFGIGTITGLVYPVITLALLNTTFKDDLVN